MAKQILTGSIYEDLKVFEKKYGKEFVLALAAKVISEYCWWNWAAMKNGLLTDEQLKQKFEDNENG